MSKIIPWSLPSITGGSQGGYTPTPAPEPVVDNEYYDFSEMVVERAVPAYGSKSVYSNVNVTGIVTKNITGVKQFKYVFTAKASTTSQADADSSGTTLTRVKTVTASENPEVIADPNMTYLGYLEYTGTERYTYIESMTILVLGADGDILQSETVDLTGLNE